MFILTLFDLISYLKKKKLKLFTNSKPRGIPIPRNQIRSIYDIFSQANVGIRIEKSESFNNSRISKLP